MKKRNSIGAYGKAYAPFLFVAAVGLLYHLCMKPMGGDDVFFSHATDNATLWEYLSGRYLNWTSRIVSEGILVTVIKAPLLWRCVDFLMFASLPVLISKLFGGGTRMNWCAAGAVLLFPFHDMGTAGWITTTVTHFWPLWGMFYLALLVKKLAAEERLPPAEVLAGIPIGLMVGSHEQYAVILFAVLVLYGFYLVREKREPSNLPAFLSLAVTDVLSLLVIAFCPGNAGRNAVSLADLPIYETFGFEDKLYLGLLGIERVFIANVDIVFFSVLLVWVLLVYAETDDYKKTLISGLPLLILFGQSVVRTAYPGLSGLFVIPGEVLSWSWGELSTWLPMAYLLITVVCMIYALFQLFGEDLVQFFYVLILLGLGFGAGMILGFVATIYVSGERVYAPLYAILLSVTLYAVKKMTPRAEEKLHKTAGWLVMTLLALVCLVNVGFIALSM